MMIMTMRPMRVFDVVQSPAERSVVACMSMYVDCHLRLQLNTKNPKTSAKRKVEIVSSFSGSNMDNVAAAMIKMPELWLSCEHVYARVNMHT